MRLAVVCQERRVVQRTSWGSARRRGRYQGGREGQVPVVRLAAKRDLEPSRLRSSYRESPERKQQLFEDSF